ncbi:MAG TPA: sugar ABC transporter substrate-binding protein [Ktedonosporobacter sp.]|nr:sugar ABC transporter substrate-binding protein [Ktedonosporobacter sp.]
MDDMHYLLADLQAGRIDRRGFIKRALAAGISFSGIAAMLQSCGGGGGGSGSGSSGPAAITWSTWGNPGEIARFQAFTAKYNADHKANAKLVPIPVFADYLPKILTELNGGVAPDVFYADGTHIAKLVENQTIVELSSLLASSKSAEKADDYISGLWSSTKTLSGKIYGVPVDCNPLVLWYNKNVLQQAGVTDDPATLASQGKWTKEAFAAILEKVKATGKYGYILDDEAARYWSWVTTHDGKVFDNNGFGNFIAQDDPNAVEILTWLVTNVRSKLITFGATLPKGQGDDLAFMANQVAFVEAGRWYLPEFKTANGLQYDIVPWPSKSGQLAPAHVPSAYIVLNKKSKNPDAAFDFLTNFVSVAGQTFRLQGGGNAVPSIKGPDDVVISGNNPAHAQTFLDARNAGWALFPAQQGTPALSDDLKTSLEPVFLQGADLKTTLAKIAQMANPRIQQAQTLFQ